MSYKCCEAVGSIMFIKRAKQGGEFAPLVDGEPSLLFFYVLKRFPGIEHGRYLVVRKNIWSDLTKDVARREQPQHTTFTS